MWKLYFLFHCTSIFRGCGSGLILFCVSLLFLNNFFSYLNDNFLLFFSTILFRFFILMVSLISSFLNAMISYLYKLFKHKHIRKVITFSFFWPSFISYFIVFLFFFSTPLTALSLYFLLASPSFLIYNFPLIIVSTCSLGSTQEGSWI